MEKMLTALRERSDSAHGDVQRYLASKYPTKVNKERLKQDIDAFFAALPGPSDASSAARFMQALLSNSSTPNQLPLPEQRLSTCGVKDRIRMSIMCGEGDSHQADAALHLDPLAVVLRC